jgi:hypothetical protein
MTGMPAVRASARSRRVAQREIHHDDVGRTVGGALECLHAIAGLDDVEPDAGEMHGVHLPRVGVVVDNEHERTLTFRGH